MVKSLLNDQMVVYGSWKIYCKFMANSKKWIIARSKISKPKIFYNIIIGHKWLYKVGDILHLDMSKNNIIIIDGDYKKRLIDLNLAKKRDNMPSKTNHQTRIMQFKIIGVLQGEDHTY